MTGPGRQPAPRVSVGVPVYNGANYLREALESIVSQTFEDFEVVISDNASTDETPDICAEFVEKDERFQYVRNRRNIGAGPNYHQIFELSSGEYFKIANHDDVCHPRFLELCVAALDARPDAVCAFPATVDIDESGEIVRELPKRPKFGSPDVGTRLWEGLRFGEEPQALFGVLRSDVVAKTGIMDSVPSADRVWLTELLMYGPFVEIDEPLFLHREHPLRSVHTAGRGHASMAWWDPSKMKRFSFPYWRMFGSLARAIRSSPLRGADRREAYSLMFKWTRENMHAMKLVYDVAIPFRGMIDRYYSGETTTRA